MHLSPIDLSFRNLTSFQGDITFLELTRYQNWAQYWISWGEMDAKDIEWTYIGKTTLSEGLIEDRGTQIV